MFHLCCKHFYVVVELFGVGDYNSIDFLDSFDGRATKNYLLEAAGFSKCELGANPPLQGGFCYMFHSHLLHNQFSCITSKFLLIYQVVVN